MSHRSFNPLILIAIAGPSTKGHIKARLAIRSARLDVAAGAVVEALTGSRSARWWTGVAPPIEPIDWEGEQASTP